MEKNRGVKVVAVIALIVAVVGLTIAYASLSVTLNITGSAKVTPANWDVEFENPAVDEESKIGGADGTAPTLEGKTTLKDSQITLTKPGDSITFTFDVVNKGDIKAKLSTLTMPEVSALTYEGTALEAQKTTDENTVKENIEYKLTDESGSEITDGGTLVLDTDSNQRKKMKLTMTYKSTAQSIPSAAVNISGLDISMIFEQAD